jgi:hypothetical protein
MRGIFNRMVVAGLIGLGVIASHARASAIMNYTLTTTTNAGGLSGKWQLFEQNTYDNVAAASGFTAAHPSSGLYNFHVTVKSSGAVTIGSSASVKAPTGHDVDSDISNGFVILPGNNYSPSGQGSQTLFGGQPLTYLTNPPGDVNNVYLGVGNVAETVNVSDDGSNDPSPGIISTINIANPVLIGTGTWTQTGQGGTIFVDVSTRLIDQELLPNPMPTPAPFFAPSIQGVNPDSITDGSVNVPAVPEPASSGVLLAGGLMTLARRRRASSRV